MIHACFVALLTVASLSGALRTWSAADPHSCTPDPLVGPGLPVVDRLEVDIPPTHRNVRAEPPNYLLQFTPMFLD